MTDNPGPDITEEQRSFYNEHGYLIIENALELFGNNHIKAAYERLEAERKPAWEQAIQNGTNAPLNGPNSHIMEPDFGKEPIFLDLANNAKIIPLISQIVGPSYQVMNITCHNHPAQTNAHTGWHRDWQTWTHPRFRLRVKVFYYFEDQNEDMGCFALVPGTHRHSERVPHKEYDGETLEDMPDMVKIALPAGSAILWDALLWHTGLANVSAKDRRIVMYTYTQFFLKNWESTTPDPNMVAWADTPQKRQLMGIHSITGRRAWDRQEVPYLPEQEERSKAKIL